MASLASCIFCKIIKGDIPSKKILETAHSYAFLDVGPLSRDHGEKLHDIPDEYLADVLPVAKKVAIATGAADYNILQNNGKIAHQVVPHVHFHVIPKPSESDTEGLVIGWPTKPADQTELQKLLEEMQSKL
ncbi:unnamed protein product [Rhizoctonia solani]|uniref:HIT domain-containing protein n=1 Tax=Rhizoctonia solani TaxID=456999 RepID=A0A8H3E5E0_9AGAM|nr:unnamed protein product [Rhizoctonia solani]